MESFEIIALLGQLDDDIDDLEDALTPILNSTLSTASSKLPILDKAKLYVLITYAIESILFSYLRLHGVPAREHPVFKELTRVKQYFGKLKAAEAPTNQRSVLSLDKQAAARFAGNNELDSKNARRQEIETTRSHTQRETLSRTTNKATSNLPSSTSGPDASNVNPTNVGTEPSRAYLISKKRKADPVDDLAPTTPLSRTDSDLEQTQSRHKKSRKEKKK